MNLIDNRKAHFDFEILEQFEAGIELVGHEVKSLRAHRGDLTSAYAILRNTRNPLKKEVWLKNVFIPPFQENNTPKLYNPRRDRRLLLGQKDIASISRAIEEKSNRASTLIPLSLYTNGRMLKVALGVARGKKKYDKRASTMKRENNRIIERTMKRGAF